MEKGAVIFLDESHQLPKKIQDNLLSALERPALLITDIKGQMVEDPLPDHITFMFATTNKSYIRDTLLSRMEEIELGEYSIADKQAIAVKTLMKVHGLQGSQLEIDAIIYIARIARSGRGVVRLCDATVRNMRLSGRQKLTLEDVSTVCNIRDIDENGLTKVDRRYLAYLHEHGSVGIDNLEAYLNMPRRQIQEKIEPFLIRNKLVVRQSSGRVITNKGFDAMQMKRIEYE
jgi:Holliday junction DNA helicase RuvB